MLGFFFIFLGGLFDEFATSIGKDRVAAGKESIYTMGFLNTLWAALLFFGILIFEHRFVFSLQSLPTFLLRAVLEVVLAHATILAITRADRSTFSFIRTGTLPLLLGVDIALGYTVTVPQMAGIGIIVLSFLLLFINQGIRTQGMKYVVFTTIMAVATISLYKYNISHYNSVAAEQLLICLILLLYFFIKATWVAKENPFHFLRQPIFFSQSLAEGIASALISFAFLFAAASVMATAKRSLGMLWALLSGNFYFKEPEAGIKLFVFVLICFGLTLMAF